MYIPGGAFSRGIGWSELCDAGVVFGGEVEELVFGVFSCLCFGGGFAGVAGAAENSQVSRVVGAALAGGDDVVNFPSWRSAELAGVVVSLPYACAEMPGSFRFVRVVCVHRSCLMAAGAGLLGTSSGWAWRHSAM